MSEETGASEVSATGSNYGNDGVKPTQEYIDAMTSKADAGLGKSAPQEKLYAGKYKSEEDLQKGILELAKKQAGGDLESFYKSLEKGFGKAESSPDTDSAEPEDAPETKAPDTSEATSPIDKASIEWAESGEISEDTYASLEKVGLPKDMVQAFIAGQEALAEKATNEILNIVGGPKAYEHMKSWAMENCTPEEIKQFNAAIVSNNMPSVKMAIRSMNALYIEREGKAPNLIKPSVAGNVNTSGYESRAQMTADMKDPRYAKDPAFRRQVMERVKNSRI